MDLTVRAFIDRVTTVPLERDSGINFVNLVNILLALLTWLSDRVRMVSFSFFKLIMNLVHYITAMWEPEESTDQYNRHKTKDMARCKRDDFFYQSICFEPLDARWIARSPSSIACPPVHLFLETTPRTTGPTICIRCSRSTVLPREPYRIALPPRLHWHRPWWPSV